MIFPVTEVMADAQEYEGNPSIVIGDNKILRVSHIGRVRLKLNNRFLELKNTLCVTKLRKNLISIQALTSDFTLQFCLCAKGFVI